MRPRHSDADLLDLAREGSSPAFASLLHRHRDVLQRGALRAGHPERIAEAAMVGAIRALRRGRLRPDDLREGITALVEERIGRDPGRPGVERLLPGDWFDRAWVRAERTWPTGRRRLPRPRWALQLVAAVALAAAASTTAYLVITTDATTEVLSELVAEPIEDPEMLVVPGPIVEQTPEQPPELFGDIELGELPTYDLTSEGERTSPPAPSLGPQDRADVSPDQTSSDASDAGPD